MRPRLKDELNVFIASVAKSVADSCDTDGGTELQAESTARRSRSIGDKIEGKSYSPAAYTEAWVLLEVHYR